MQLSPQPVETAPLPPGSFRLPSVFPWLVGPVVAVLVFGATLFTYFTGEDFVFVHFVADGHAFWQPSQNLFYRPLPNLLWQFDWWLWGLNAGGYHLTNLLLHALNAGLVGWLARRLGLSAGASGWAAVLFALHPAHVEPVAWLAGRPDLLATTLALLSLIFTHKYLAETKPRFSFYLLGWLGYGLALFCKEAVVALPLVSFLWAWLLIKPHPDWRKLALAFGPHLLLLLGYGWIRWQALGGLGGYEGGLSLAQVGWNATIGVWWPLLWPFNFESSGWPVGLIGIVGLSLAWVWLVWRGWVALTQYWLRLILPGLLLLYLTLGPALNNAPISLNLSQSRILYLPSVGFCLIVAGVIQSGGFGLVKWRSSILQVLPSSKSKSFKKVIYSQIPLLLLAGICSFGCAIALWPWAKAESLVEETFRLLAAQHLLIGPGDLVYYEGLPDSWQGAYVWRNGLDDATALLVNPTTDGQFRIPDLKIDYRLPAGSQVWFVRYGLGPGERLLYGFDYSVSGFRPDRLTSTEDYTACASPPQQWQFSFDQGHLKCIPNEGQYFTTGGAKTNLTLTGLAIQPPGSVFYVDIATNLDYEFEQYLVLAQVSLLDQQNNPIYTQPFDMAADGKDHRYRLRLPTPSQPGPFRVRIRLNKFRTNVSWKWLGWGVPGI